MYSCFNKISNVKTRKERFGKSLEQKILLDLIDILMTPEPIFKINQIVGVTHIYCYLKKCLYFFPFSVNPILVFKKAQFSNKQGNLS